MEVKFSKTDLHEMRAAIGAIIMATEASTADASSPFFSMIRRNADQAMKIIEAAETSGDEAGSMYHPPENLPPSQPAYLGPDGSILLEPPTDPNMAVYRLPVEIRP